MSTKCRSLGYSLIELIVFMVIVGVSLAGVMSVFTTTVKSSTDPLVHKQETAIAESLLEEILHKAYADPDGVGGESSRAFMDDVADYDGLSLNGSQVYPGGGAALPALAVYQATVSVVDATLGTVPALKVTVSVSGHGETIALSGYKTDY